MTGPRALRRLLISTNAVVIAVLAGQVLAFLREMVIAAEFGASPSTDAYFVAFSIPDIFLQLSLSGAAASALIPLVAAHAESHGEKAGWAISTPILRFYLLVSVAAVPIGWFAMPTIVNLLAPGFTTDTASLTILLGRTMLPVIVFISVAAALTGLLNYYGKFFVPALRFGIQSVFVIAAVYVLASRLHILSAGIGVLVGAAASLTILLPLPDWRAIRQHTIPFSEQIAIIRRYFRLALPIMLTGIVVQVSIFAEKIAASYFEGGSVAALVLARKVAFVAIALGAQSFLTVIYPRLAASALRKEDTDFRRNVRFAAGLLLFGMGVVAILVTTFAETAAQLIFERGSFDPTDTIRVAGVLRWFGIGIPIFSINSLLVRVCHSRQLVYPPLMIGLAVLGPYVLMLLILPRHLGMDGIVIALVIADTIRMFLLGIYLQRKIPRLFFGYRGIAMTT